MGSDSKHNYDESKIKTLSSLEHIRLRTDMYIGRIGDGSHYDDGAYILLKEVIDNAIDEYIMGFGKEIVIEIEDKKVSVRDFGRGIPLGKVVDCVSTINTGAKYNDEVFQFSVGLNGVGTKAVNALSQAFLVRSHRDGQFAEASFSKGDLKDRKKGKSKNEPNGTYVEFVPDAGIFKKLQLRSELIERRLKHYSYLNSGLKLICNGETFHSRHGLLDLIKEDVEDEAIYPAFYYSSKTLEFCFTHSTGRSG
ncbi:MAG: type IIA DNA topoisomerase subunit B, partial [Verrucomicrobia bacterium]|nr:type IIA DNA topoisomerase subunit B [Verrucomicrobiota bacterium]